MKLLSITLLLAAVVAFAGTADGCVDIAHDCVPKRYLCNNPAYRKLMAKQCPQTCGFCGFDAVGDEECVDVAHDCVPKKHLCVNPLYHDLVKKVCKKTCGFC